MTLDAQEHVWLNQGPLAFEREIHYVHSASLAYEDESVFMS